MELNRERRVVEDLLGTSVKIAVKSGVFERAVKATAIVGSGTLTKKIPVAGLFVGAGLAIKRLYTEPITFSSLVLAYAEFAFGAVSIVPGVGTLASLAIDGAILAVDLEIATNLGQRLLSRARASLTTAGQWNTEV